MKKLLLAITVLFCLPIATNAQVLAPDFLCVTNDTLKWELPANNCGPFIDYKVFGSRDISGPFDTIAVITDQTVTSFFHADATSETWFYYLQGNFDCPGSTILSSDTLNNLIPEISPIQFVTVNTNNVEIHWAESPSPEVFAYIIYRETSSGTTAIDTAFGITSYTDITANAQNQVESYFVNSLDRCGNTSLFGDPHNTMLANITAINTCTQSIELEWNLYQNWMGGTDRQEVWVSNNGGDFELAGTVDASTTVFTFENANDMDTYCFFIKSIEAGTEFGSSSNVICETLDIVQPVRDFALLNATVTGSDSIELAWAWDPTSEIALFSINRSTDDFNFSIATEGPPNFPLSERNTFLDLGLGSISGPLTYRIDATDDCGTSAATNTVKTSYLTAEAKANGENILNWTPYSNELGEVSTYEVRRIVNGKDELLVTVPGTSLSFTDLIDLRNPTEASACYYVLASVNISVPPGRLETVQSQSNIACAQQSAQVFVPNAFVPDGFNTEFRPILQFGNPVNYTMIIYDRWGGKLFESQTLEDGWDGKKENEPLPQGVYAYYIRVAQEGGIVTERKGTVLLLR